MISLLHKYGENHRHCRDSVAQRRDLGPNWRFRATAISRSDLAVALAHGDGGPGCCCGDELGGGADLYYGRGNFC